MAHDIVKGKTVLELGCGLGYGVWLLVTGGASRVVALDLDKAKIFHTVGSCPYYHDRVLRVIRIAIPSFVRTWIKNLYHHNNHHNISSLDIAIPASIPGDWPFYIDDVTKDCLGFFAICGFDNRFVCQVTNGIKRSG
ncbi:MAG: hypothetical protein DRN68_03960 [Thaumarchaeota archaeon]|nr:MAG: hypothetical protein DRN68_03960 [Nitrososphaerota archaeon]